MNSFTKVTLADSLLQWGWASQILEEKLVIEQACFKLKVAVVTQRNYIWGVCYCASLKVYVGCLLLYKFVIFCKEVVIFSP